jgi:hypothetical protein
MESGIRFRNICEIRKDLRDASKTSIHVNHILATETHFREMYLEAGLFPEIFF